MLKRIKLALLTIVLFSCSGAFAQPDIVHIDDLRDQWLLFSSRNNFYFPFVENSLDGVSSISFPLEFSKYERYDLYLKAPAGSSVFFNQQIVAFMEDPGYLLFPIDSLQQAYKGESLFVTLYNPQITEESELATSIVETAGQQISDAGYEDGMMHFLRRDRSGFGDFFGVAVVILLLFYAVLLNINHKRMRGYYNVGRMLSLNIREEVTFKGKVFDGNNIPILLVHSFLVSFIGLFILSGREGMPNLHRFGQSMAAWTLGAGIVFLLFVFKFWLLSLAGSLFKLPFAVRHYLEYLRMSKIFFTALFFLALVLFLTFKTELNNINQIIVNFVILFLIVRVVVLYFKFIGVTAFKNLYLFSYLCSTEILPMVVGLKILLGK